MQSDNTPSETTSDTQDTKNGAGFVKEILKFALLAIIIVVPIRLYVASPFIVSGSSMAPTFNTGNYLIVDQLFYTLGETPERGDVIVFRFPKDPDTFFIKRVIGLPNETVTIRDGDVSIENEDLVQTLPLTEPYVTHTSNDDKMVTLGTEEYFVMGDNRDGSSDSRVWGALPEDLIIGRAMIRLFPVSEFDLWPGQHNY